MTFMTFFLARWPGPFVATIVLELLPASGLATAARFVGQPRRRVRISPLSALACQFGIERQHTIGALRSISAQRVEF